MMLSADGRYTNGFITELGDFVFNTIVESGISTILANTTVQQ
jgi:hypothetical protein